MAFQRGVHRAIQLHELARVFADDVRPQLAQPRAHALGVGGKIERPERTDFAVADDARVRLHADDGAIEDGDGFSAAPFVGGFDEREFDAIGEDAGDFHFEVGFQTASSSA